MKYYIDKYKTEYKLTIIASLLVMMLAFVACVNPYTNEIGAGSSEPMSTEIVSTETMPVEITSTEETPTDNIDTVTNQSYHITTEDYSIDLSSIPPYSGTPCAELNSNQPAFTSEEIASLSGEFYSGFDSLGRCGVAYAIVGLETMPTEPRGEIGNVKPSGWHTVKYNDLIEDNYLYNRCHLIAYSLAGENDNPLNLITGTRYMNISGMAPFEREVENYVIKTNNHVLYRVTPVFEGDNLVASGVEMEAFSIEDNGEGIKFHVYCYNVQPGIVIDYATGDSWVEEDITEVISTEAVPPKELPDEEPEYNYVLNKNTKKFHEPYCDSVSDMKEKNKVYFSGTRDEAIEQGYVPCKSCNP